MESTKRHILCVEDDEETSYLLVQFLRQRGYDAQSAESAEEALALAHHESFSLYIIDSWLPAEGGTSLCRMLREFDPYTPIIIYSGLALEADGQEALHAGANVLVAKPDVKNLLEAVRSFLT
jgi:CheY-like chemotaxis protein